MAYNSTQSSNQPTMNQSDSAPTKLNTARDGFGTGLRGNNPKKRTDGTTDNDCTLLVKIVPIGGSVPTKAQMLAGAYNYSALPNGNWEDSGRSGDAYGLLAFGTAGSVSPICEEARG